MARKRGRPKIGYKFKNFEKTYRRYVRDYYRAARKKYNRTVGRKVNARIPASVSKEELRSVMYDNQLLSRADFRQDYKNYKHDLENEGSTSYPIHYIISNQTYESSRKQFLGFKEAVRSAKFKEATEGYDVSGLEKISEFKFRSGEWRSDEFYKAAGAYYHAMKEEAKAEGYTTEKEQWLYAKARVSEAFFGRERETDLYWGDSP